MLILIFQTSKNLKEKLSSGTNTDMKNWHFIHLPDSKIISLYNNLSTNIELGNDLGLPYAFIIDKSKALRGRDDGHDVKKNSAT